MSFHEHKEGDFITITLTCDARKGKGSCGNSAEITMQNREQIGKFLFNMGWRLLRGHQVCSSCLRKSRVTFPRRTA